MNTSKLNTASLAKGAALMVTAVFLFSIMDTLAKSLSANHHPFQIVWARYASQTLLAFTLLAPRLKKLLRTRQLPMQLVRSGFLFAATMGFFTSISLMPLATATATFEIGPLVITIMAFFILRETVGLRRWISVAFGFVGALIIIRPGADSFTLYALLPAFAATCFAGYAISTRFLGQEESPWTSFLYTALIGTLISSAIVPLFWTNPNAIDATKMVALGAIGGIGHYLLIRAFTITEASYLAPFTYIGLLFNALWGFLLFAEVPGSNVILGGTIIVGAGIYVWYREVFVHR
ncbi:MAG: DMT family transporter [Rhodobacteraceae bacterium]|nr:DMT family transporter [Paracoccaceae bacterium]